MVCNGRPQKMAANLDSRWVAQSRKPRMLLVRNQFSHDFWGQALQLCKAQWLVIPWMTRQMDRPEHPRCTVWKAFGGSQHVHGKPMDSSWVKSYHPNSLFRTSNPGLVALAGCKGSQTSCKKELQQTESHGKLSCSLDAQQCEEDHESESYVGASDPNFGDLAHTQRAHDAKAHKRDQQSRHNFVHDLQKETTFINGTSIQQRCQNGSKEDGDA